MTRWFDETFEDRLRFGLRVERTLFQKRSTFQEIEIFETPVLGRVLALDGVLMTSEGDEHYYHEMLVHPAMVCARSVARVLIIGGGDGGTAREVLRHSEVDKVVMVEIDGEVVIACKEHMPSLGAWDDPRLEVVIGDGIAYVADTATEPFDVIILDGTDPVGPGEGLFDAAFYRNVRRVLAPSGVFSVQSESPILTPALFRDIVTTLGDIFERAHPLTGPAPIYAAGIWSWTLAGPSVDPHAIDEERIARIGSQTRYYNRAIHTAALAQSNEVAQLLGQ